MCPFIRRGTVSHRTPERVRTRLRLAKAVFFELDGIEKDENVRPQDLVKVAKPGKVGGLVDGDDHRRRLLQAEAGSGRTSK